MCSSDLAGLFWCAAAVWLAVRTIRATAERQYRLPQSLSLSHELFGNPEVARSLDMTKVSRGALGGKHTIV